MAITPSGLAPAVGRAARWTSRLLSAAAGKFGLLVVALVALMGAAPLIIPSPASRRRAHALHRGRAGGEPPRGPAGRETDGGRARPGPGGLPDRAVYLPLRHPVARPAPDRALDVDPDLRHGHDPPGHLREPGSDRGDPPGGALRLPADRPVRGVRLHPHRPDVPGLVPGVARAGPRLGGRAVEGDRVHAAVRLQLCDAVRVELRGDRPGDRVRL